MEIGVIPIIMHHNTNDHLITWLSNPLWPHTMLSCCSCPLDACHCSCHVNSGSMHIMACCRTCPKCGVNIHLAKYNDHMKSCDNYDDDDNDEDVEHRCKKLFGLTMKQQMWLFIALITIMVVVGLMC